MKDPIIQRLYQERLKAFADAQGFPLQLPNTTFTPPSNVEPRDNTFLRAFYLPATTTSTDLAGESNVYRGIFQIDVVTAKGIGDAAGDAIALPLFDLFPNNLVLTALDGFEVQQITPLRQRPRLTGDTTYVLPLDFGYYASA